METSEAAAKSLEPFVAPLSSREFLERYWSKSFLHIPGQPGKFSDVLPWSRLNEILAYHQFPAENLRIYKNSERIPAKRYTHASGYEQRLMGTQLTRLLADGATLILNNVDDLDPKIRKLAIALERTFRTHAWVNLYAGWRTTRGFDLHWDDHHTIILQVHGRKRWQVYNPTRPYPFLSDTEKAPRPTEPPIWDDVLEEGGFLHIPRGWWHVAQPLDQPCLHLTIGFADPTGAGLVRWLAERLKTNAVVRQSIPHLDGPRALSDHRAAIWRAIEDAWTPDVLDRYLAHFESDSPPRAELQLPGAASPDAALFDQDSTIQLAPSCRLDLSNVPQDGMLSFGTFGREWRCPESALPILRVLNDGHGHRVADLMALAPGASDSLMLHTFLASLMMEGVVFCIGAGGDDQSKKAAR